MQRAWGRLHQLALPVLRVVAGDSKFEATLCCIARLPRILGWKK